MEENLDEFDYMIINVESCLNGSLNTTINFDYGTARILSALQDIYERHSNTFATFCRLRTADTENLQASVFFGIGE